MEMINIPNLISLLRIFVAPIFYVFFLSNNNDLVKIGCLIFILASITDIIDGWAARRFGIVTRYGEFLDPLADKILTLLALISFVKIGIIPAWMLIIIFCRDVFSTSLRVIAIARGTSIITSRSAKVKTTVEMSFISFILMLIYLKLTYDSVYQNFFDKIIYSPISYILALIITLMALYSLAEYAYKYRNLIKMFKKSEKIEKKF
ncbi:MAG: CDP-diacylglycerol--glycerol-3-phosphate 3-phosphatidyltransferase [Candidatus Kapaibacteriota bacterium]